MKKNIIITDFNRWRDYALWYYFRYFPSVKKLENRLLIKTDNNHDLVNKILSSMNELFQEDEIIRSKINNYLFRNKNLSYIRWKLHQKLFNQSQVDEILNTEFLLSWDTLLTKSPLLRKIQSYKNKNKSISQIKNQCIERKEDEELVLECIHEVFGTAWDIESISNIYNDLKNTLPKEKIIKKLISRWFFYNDINKVVKN